MKKRRDLAWVPTDREGRRWELWEDSGLFGRVAYISGYVAGYFTATKPFSYRWKEVPVDDLQEGARYLLECHQAEAERS